MDIKHYQITWGIHPPDYAPRCHYFVYDHISQYQDVTCVACLQQIIADLTLELSDQTQVTQDWKSLATSKYKHSHPRDVTSDCPACYEEFESHNNLPKELF